MAGGYIHIGTCILSKPNKWHCYICEKHFDSQDLRVELEAGKVCLKCIAEHAVKMKDAENHDI